MFPRKRYGSLEHPHLVSIWRKLKREQEIVGMVWLLP